MAERFAVTVDKQYLQFCSAHFITFHGMRERLHGHNYHCSVTVEGELAPDGYVLDFGDLKQAARAACEALDHLVVLPSENAEIAVERREGSVVVAYREDRFLFPAGDVLILPVSNTTSEQFARYLADDILRRLPPEIQPGLRRIAVSVEEAPGQRAAFGRDLTPVPSPAGEGNDDGRVGASSSQ